MLQLVVKEKYLPPLAAKTRTLLSLSTLNKLENISMDFTIVIPTYHEVENIPELVKRISNVNFGNRAFEVLLVDDNSQDGTVELVNSLTKKYSWLQFILRDGKKSLSQSVITGFENARYPLIITMDADLSHPPEAIPTMLDLLAQPQVDIVIGSRYISGGSIDHKWPLRRKLASWLAAFIARLLLMSKTRDPLSGFIAIRKETLMSAGPLKSIGWKIGLEIMVKCHCKNIREIPIHFSQRRLGMSKLNLKISLEYLYHIIQLTYYKIFIFSSKRTYRT
ncbi:MAG: polyprenol monophosphomannose synthase [Gammaproteobacteria bacterium]|nr:polyprenol monophosphomannose synthase [Gammaproteobacteria bacterium]MCW5583135.1 polyprenol monophosphomannose synthase [Gammaproteobacteria bacterium]